MTPTSKNARIAGFLYLLLAIACPVRLMYIPKTLFVYGDAEATTGNIVAHEVLFRLGIGSDLFYGFGYLAMSLTGLLLPNYSSRVETITFPALTGEVVFLLWLLIRGAKEQTVSSPAS